MHFFGMMVWSLGITSFTLRACDSRIDQFNFVR